MIDPKHILSLDEKELKNWLLAKIVPKPWEHSIVYRPKDDSNWCKKCKLGIRDVSLMGYCPIPDPIDLDANLAEKMISELIFSQRMTYERIIEEMRLAQNTVPEKNYWQLFLLTPQIRISAAIFAKKRLDK